MGLLECYGVVGVGAASIAAVVAEKAQQTCVYHMQLRWLDKEHMLHTHRERLKYT